MKMFELIKLIKENNVVNLYGMSGVGKTSLGMEVMKFFYRHELFKNGIFFCVEHKTEILKLSDFVKNIIATNVQNNSSSKKIENILYKPAGGTPQVDSYKIKIANRGNLNAQLASINFISDNKTYIDYSIKGIEVGTKLKSGKTKTIEVKLKYNGNIDDSFKEYSDTKLILNWKQDTK